MSCTPRIQVASEDRRDRIAHGFHRCGGCNLLCSSVVPPTSLTHGLLLLVASIYAALQKAGTIIVQVTSRLFHTPRLETYSGRIHDPPLYQVFEGQQGCLGVFGDQDWSGRLPVGSRLAFVRRVSNESCPIYHILLQPRCSDGVGRWTMPSL
jgi:hypothetical protein